MSQSEIEMFLETVKGSRNYLEYGSGGSTKTLAKLFPDISVTSVESDAEFIQKEVMQDEHVQNALKAGMLKFLVPDLGPVGKWGYPTDQSKIHLWPNYALCPFMHGYQPDFILIDGRFRVACGLLAALQAPAAKVLVHDYTIRKSYSILERFFDIDARVDTLVQLKVKSSFDSMEAFKLSQTYLYLPGDEPQDIKSKMRNQLKGLKGKVSRIIKA